MNAVLALKPTVRKLKFQVMFPPLKIFVKNMNIIAQCIPCVTKVITRVSHPNEIREHFASKILCFQFINAIKSISQGRIILLIGFSWPKHTCGGQFEREGCSLYPTEMSEYGVYLLSYGADTGIIGALTDSGISLWDINPENGGGLESI